MAQAERRLLLAGRYSANSWVQLLVPSLTRREPGPPSDCGEGFPGQGGAGGPWGGAGAGRGGAGSRFSGCGCRGRGFTAAERAAEQKPGGDSGCDFGERGANAAGVRQGSRAGTRRERRCGGARASRAPDLVERGVCGSPHPARNALQPRAREGGS